MRNGGRGEGGWLIGRRGRLPCCEEIISIYHTTQIHPMTGSDAYPHQLTSQLFVISSAVNSNSPFLWNGPEALNTAAAHLSPNSFLACSNAFLTSASSATLVETPIALPPDLLISSTSELKLSGLRARSATGYAWANLRATAAPVPGPTPAIIANGAILLRMERCFCLLC